MRSVVALFLFCVSLPIAAQSSRKIKLSPVSLGFDLPDSYKKRTFVRGLSGFTNKIDQLAGSMVLIDNNKTQVLTRFVRPDKPPVVSTSTSDIIYSAKIDSRFKFNGQYSIASTQIGKDNVCELVITDVAYAFVSEDHIPYLDICRASGNVPAETRKKTFYIRSAKLTTIYTRIYSKVSSDSDVAGVVFSVGGDVFSSTEQFKVDYVVSVDLVSLDNLLSLHNCEQMITTDEASKAEMAEKARQQASNAEKERQTREQELAEAKQQVESMKQLMHQSLLRNEEMQQQMAKAQERESQALQQLNMAIQTANEMAEKARAAEKEAAAPIVLTLKNKEGQVLEIKSLEELSADKLKELGFEVSNVPLVPEQQTGGQ